jgi:hypothetical protein
MAGEDSLCWWRVNPRRTASPITAAPAVRLDPRVTRSFAIARSTSSDSARPEGRKREGETVGALATPQTPRLALATLHPPNTESKQKGVDLADLAYAGLEMKLRQHDNVIRYGNIQLRHLPRLTDSDLMFLNKEMRDLRPIVWEAGESIRVLLLTLLHFLSNTGGNDARYWVAEELKASHLPRAERVLARFDEQVEAGVDSREALAAFQAHYFKSMEWSERMASFLEQPLDSFAEFSNWRVRHGQYVEVFKRKLELPQFEVLKHWYYSSKTMRSLPLLF